MEDDPSSIGERVRRMYAHYNPDALSVVDGMLLSAVGHESDVLRALVQVYGPEPSPPPPPPRPQPPVHTKPRHDQTKIRVLERLHRERLVSRYFMKLRVAVLLQQRRQPAPPLPLPFPPQPSSPTAGLYAPLSGATGTTSSRSVVVVHHHHHADGRVTTLGAPRSVVTGASSPARIHLHTAVPMQEVGVGQSQIPQGAVRSPCIPPSDYSSDEGERRRLRRGKREERKRAEKEARRARRRGEMIGGWSVGDAERAVARVCSVCVGGYLR